MSGSVDEVDSNRMPLRSYSSEQMQDFVYLIFEKSFHNSNMTTMCFTCSVQFGNLFEGRMTSQKMDVVKRNSTLLLVCHYTEALQVDKGFVYMEIKQGGDEFQVQSQWPDTCKTSSKFLPEKGDNTNTRVQVHAIMCTSCYIRKMHEMTSSQLTLPLVQLYLEGGDMRTHVCGENIFALKLHIDII